MDEAAFLLEQCALFQRKMFLRHFLSTGKIGEIMASQVNDHGDRVFYERFSVADLSFVAVFNVMMEDSMILQNYQFAYHKISDFVDARERENRLRFANRVDEDMPYEEFTRQMVEDRLSPGKMTINGDRNSQIRILYRQTEVPSDVQQPRLNEYVLLKPLEVVELEQLTEQFVKQLISEEEYVKAMNEWKKDNLFYGMQTVHPELATSLPFLRAVSRVTPRIYEWPIEVDVEREAGLK